MSAQLFTIDVAAELRSLCEAQLRGTWQLPAEIVRFAVRHGAESVSARHRRGRWTIAWQGPPLGEPALAGLSTALDERSPVADRQRAIVAIESSGDEALLWAAGLRGADLRVVSAGGGRRLSLRCGGRSRPRLERAKADGERPAVEVSWSCSGLDRRRAAAWLEAAVRFADLPISIDGRPAPQGFENGLFQVTVGSPLPSRIALTRDGDEPLLWLLKNGVVAARAGVPGLPAFEAAVEMAGEVGPGASSADLRRAVNPHLEAIIDRAVWMMLEVADRLERLPGADRQRMVVLLLKAARQGRRARQIRELAMLPTAAGSSLSLAAVAELGLRRGGVLSAVSPDIGAGDGLLDAVSTLELSTEARGLVAEISGVRFQTPRRRHRGVRARVRGWVADAVRKARRWLLGVLPRAPVADDLLSTSERRLLSLLRTALDPIDVVLSGDTRGPGMRPGTVVLGRRHPVVIDAATAVSSDAAWLYPVLLALGFEGGADDARRRWCDSLVRQ